MLEQQMPGGYNGRILRVNLSTGECSAEQIDEMFCRKYIGGAGFITYYLLSEIPTGIDPLGPENKLIFAAGPMTGIPISGAGRHCIGAKSPQTGGYAKSEVGGFWGAELKRAGFDAVIVEGKAASPVYLWIHEGEATVRDAGRLWGRQAKETQEMIKEELGDNLVRVALIGPGGENCVRFACIMNDLKNAAGRGGLGAVMGSKNLKAIAVRGHGKIRPAQPETIKELNKWLLNNKQLWASFHDFGTGAAMANFVKTGNIPIHNFRDGEFADIGLISAEAVRDTIRVKMESCFGCAVRCKKVVEVKEPYSVDPAYGGPEYETLAAIGANCGISDLKAIAKGNELCNANTLDTISTGVTISFAMECFENGLLTAKDTHGIDLRFGNAEAMLQTIEAIAKREGIGELLADGMARAAQKIGKGADKYAMQVKGLEIPMHEPRLKASLGLGYIVNPHGADHCANVHDTAYTTQGRQFDRVRALGILRPLPAEDLSMQKVALFRYEHLFRIAQDSLVTCMFVPYDMQQTVSMLSAATGWKTSLMELLRVGERVLTMARVFNLREGFTAADDKLPDRFFEPKRTGVLANRHYSREELDRARSYYYTLMGWDSETGVPTREKLEELEIV